MKNRFLICLGDILSILFNIQLSPTSHCSLTLQVVTSIIQEYIMTDFTINNRTVTLQEIENGTASALSPNEQDVFDFVGGWLTGEKQFRVHTSGSTGTPKAIVISREQMVLSAQKTGNFLGLQIGNSALICLSAAHIAGKMMLVRCLELGLTPTIIDAYNNPFLLVNRSFDFTALVPLQVQSILKNEATAALFHQTKKVIIGGSPLNSNLEKQLLNAPNDIYQTYGMTETVSHVALKNISSGQKEYHALPDVHFGIDDRNCLVVNAPMATPTHLVTNDVVDLTSSTSFVWKGRADFIINTGGIKVQTEVLEKQIARIFKQQNIQIDFFVFSEKDELLGEKICLCVNSKLNDILPTLNEQLPKFHTPKLVYFLNEFQYNNSGKLDRKKCIELIRK